MRLELVLTMRDIYINSNLNPLTLFNSNSRSTQFKDIFPWNISQIITKTVPISTRVVISKWIIPFWAWCKVNGNSDNMIRISQCSKSHCRTNTTVKRGLWESQSGIWVGKLSIWVRSFKIENNRVHQIYKFHQNKLASPYDAC